MLYQIARQGRQLFRMVVGAAEFDRQVSAFKDHLVGQSEQRCWHVEAQRFRFMPTPSARNDIVAAEIVILKGLGTIW